MNKAQKYLTQFSLLMLAGTLMFGVVAAFAYLYPEFFNKYIPFYQLRPMHVSAALFWIISGAASGLLFYKNKVFRSESDAAGLAANMFTGLWIFTIIAVFGFYAFKQFGGREYWEFPPLLGIPLVAAWLCLMYAYFISWRKASAHQPLYVWMWSTGLLFFLITFLEQNLYQIPWFRQSFLREVTVQWKSNGAMVGAWNQMIYGTSLYIMVKLSGDEQIGGSKQAYFFYFLGLTNLMFNWGHHIYNLPTSSWVRHVSYVISMTEWLILINIIRGFKNKITEQQKYRHLVSYRFIIASEYWVLLNLCLALLMSIPAINRYTHGTHITVAHAMGATIGINTMILLASLGYMLRVDEMGEHDRSRVRLGLNITQVSLTVFWLVLVVAGIMKGYRAASLHQASFQEIMQPVNAVLHVFALAGIGLFTGIGIVVLKYLKALISLQSDNEEAIDLPERLINQPAGLRVPVGEKITEEL